MNISEIVPAMADQGAAVANKAMGISDKAKELSNIANELKELVVSFTNEADALISSTTSISHGSTFMSFLTIFVLAIFVGYYVVWRVTPALHSPLMAVTNAVSSVIIVGALVAAGPADASVGSIILGFLAVILASVNIFGGFIVTQRMLSMFKKKQK